MQALRIRGCLARHRPRRSAGFAATRAVWTGMR
jgi:hypothetical protein